MSVKLLTYDVYRSGMTLFKDLADQTYQDREHLPAYYLRKVPPSETPAGFDSAYRLIYRVSGDPSAHTMGDTIGIMGSQGGGVIQAYIVGNTPFDPDWLALDPSDTALVPTKEFLYLILTPGNMYNCFVRYNESLNKYVKVLEGVGDGAVFAYEVAGKTPLNSDWLSDSPGLGSTPLVPKDCLMYLVVSAGKFQNRLYRYDATTTKYVPVSGSGSGVIFSYEVTGKTPLASDWLTDEVGGSPLTPDPELLYLDLTPGKFENFIFRYNSTTTSYVPISGGGGNGAIYAYIVGNTAFASDWLSETANGQPLDPEEGPLYLVLTPGQHYSAFYRYDETNHVYILVSNARVIDIHKADYLALPTAKQQDGTIYFIDDSSTTSPTADDYLPSRATVPTNAETGSIILWKGDITGDFQESPAFYKYNGQHWVKDPLGIVGTFNIIDSEDTPLPERNSLKFGDDFEVTDDPQNNLLEVNGYELTEEDFNEIFEMLPQLPKPNHNVILNASESNIERWLRFDPTNHKGIVIKAGTNIMLPNGKYLFFGEDRKVDLTEELGQAGKDYFLFLNADEEIHAVLNKASGEGTYFGRFHTLCANVGTIRMIVPASPSSGIVVNDNYLVKPYSQDADPDFYGFYNKKVISVSAGSAYDLITCEHPLSDYEAGDILPESVICLTWKPKSITEDAMVYDKGTDIFVDVYLQSGTGLNTKSAYNVNHTINRLYANHSRDLQLVGKRLLSDNEFTSIALGSNECSGIADAEDKTTVGGHLDVNDRRMISAIGVEEACGYVWQWLSDVASAGGSDSAAYDGRGSFGSIFGDAKAMLAGCCWSETTACGSLSRYCDASIKETHETRGARGCATFDHTPIRLMTPVALDGSYVTPVIVCAVGDTTCTFTDDHITDDALVEVEFDNTSGTFVYNTMTITTGQCVLTFAALSEQTKLRLYIRGW